ncbi:MAG: HEPN domain-containing protein [Thermoplasmataceae archaeon]
MEGEFYEFSCFLSQQSAEKALKSLYQKLGAEVYGYSVIGLIQHFPLKGEFSEKLLDEAKELDKAYIPTRYPDSYPEGSPFMMYSAEEARRLTLYAGHILERSESILSKI